MSKHADNCPAHDDLHCDCPAGKEVTSLAVDKVSPAMEKAAGSLASVMESIDRYTAAREAAEQEEEVVNPKDKWGLAKPSISSIPPVAIALLGLGMAEGERKYGLTNWRGTKVTSRLYYDAAQRHLMAWLDGEDIDPASGIPHLALAMSDMAIILDATYHGKLEDNRTPFPGSFPKWLDDNTARKDPNARPE